MRNNDLSSVTKLLLKTLKKELFLETETIEEMYTRCLKRTISYEFRRKIPSLNFEVIDRVIEIHNYYFNKIFKNNRKDCVPHSITLHLLLYVVGIESTLYVGVLRFPFSSHAWVQDMSGKILNSPEYQCKNRIVVMEKRIK